MYGVGGPAAAPYGQHPPPQSTQPQGGAAGYGYAPQQGGGAYAAPPLQQGGAQAYNQQPQAQYAAYPGAQAPPHHQGYGGGGGYGAPPHPGYGAPGGGGGFGPAGRFLAVKLRGLPFGVRDFEVAMFLGVDPVDILIVQRGGRASGEAYAVLSHPAEMDAAMRKNKAYMGSRYVEVFEARKMDYYRAIGDMFGGGGGGGGRGPPGSPGGRDRSRSPPPRRAPAGDGTSCVVKMRGLPFSATGDEISAFFADPNLGIAAPPGPDKVVVAAGYDGRPNGMAFVEFGTPQEAEAALGKDRHLMGSRYIELFISSEEERSRFQPAGALTSGGGGGPHMI